MNKSFYLVFFICFSVLSQINPTSFSKIKVTNQTENNTATRVVVQDAVSKEFHWVNKNTLGGGATPTFQQVLTAGNIVNISATSGVKAFEITSPQTGMSFFGDNILVSNSLAQFNTGLNGLNFKLNDNSKFVKFDLDGIYLKTLAVGGAVSLNTNNVTSPRTIQFPDASGVLALQSATVNLTGDQTIAGTKIFNDRPFFKSGISIGEPLNDYNISYTTSNNVLGFYEFTTPRMGLSPTSLYIGNFTTNTGIKLDISNITSGRNIQFQDKNGTLAYLTDIVQTIRVPTASSIPTASSQAGGAILIVEDTKKMYRNDGTKWQGL